MFYRFDGREIGAVGNDGDADEDYAASIAMRMSPAMGPYKNGAATQYARFGQVADAVTSFAQGTSAGTITAGAGDSLQAMALRLWGDASLWYKLAEANGLTNSSALASGQTLTVPGGIVRSANSASTFRPYDPSEALGDTSPTTPAPQAAGHKKGCGVLGSILIAVVAIAVTVASSGAAAAVIGGTNFASGLSAVLGTSVLGGVGSTVGAGALIAGGAIGGTIGSVASQGLAIATGMQRGFNWAGVAIGALSGAAGGALGKGGLFGKATDGIRAGAFSTLSPLVGSGLRGLTANIAVQGIATATGLQSKFDWAGVAAAGIGAGTGGWVGGGRFVSTAASGLANAATRSLVDSTDFGDNIVAALPDVIAQTIGGFVEDRIKGSGRGRVTVADPYSGQLAQTGVDAMSLVDGAAWSVEGQPGLAGTFSTGERAAAFNPVITDADAHPGDVVITGIIDAVYRPGSDTGLFFQVQQWSEPNPRARMGGNGGPPLEDWRVLRQLGRPSPVGPSGALFGVLDNLLDLTGPAIALQADLLDASTRSSIRDILAIDPDHSWPDRLGASGPEAESLSWKLADANFFRGELAATRYIVQGNIGALQNETLRVYQGFVDQGYEQALKEFRGGTLKPGDGWSAEQAIGSRMDELARLDMRVWYAQYRINPGLDINVTVNNRLATQPEGSYRIPDVRVGGVVFDASLSAKKGGAAQIRGFYSSPMVKTVIIVRPTMMLNGGAYALPKSGGR